MLKIVLSFALGLLIGSYIASELERVIIHNALDCVFNGCQ